MKVSKTTLAPLSEKCTMYMFRDMKIVVKMSFEHARESETLSKTKQNAIWSYELPFLKSKPLILLINRVDL